MGDYPKLLSGSDIITRTFIRERQEVREEIGYYDAGFEGATSQGM